MLICPVRDCGSPLVREDRRELCPRGHSFDVSRSGYVNLLQPQDRKSKQPGDMAAAVAARRRLHDRGITAGLLDGVLALLAPREGERVLDVGCGEGFYGGGVAARSGCQVCGLDLSSAAVELAARRYPAGQWVVANADRMIPCAGGAFSAIMSITARVNAIEFRRVLSPADGRALIAVSAPDDLIELRGRGKDRTERVTGDLGNGFVLLNRTRVTIHADVDESGVRDVLTAIYRPFTRAQASSLTFSLDLMLFGLAA